MTNFLPLRIKPPKSHCNKIVLQIIELCPLFPGILMIENNQKTALKGKNTGQVVSQAAQARLDAANIVREQRLAEALRENLKRRKAQGKARAQIDKIPTVSE